MLRAAVCCKSQADALNVTARYLATGSAYPPAVSASASDVLDQSCAVDGTKLVCSVLRSITPDAAAAKTAVDLAKDVHLLWAFGPVTAGDISYHTSRGASTTAMLLTNVSAPASTFIASDGSVSTSWMPLPDGTIDMYVERLFGASSRSSSNSNAPVLAPAPSAAESWIGIGVSTVQVSE